MQLRRPRDAVRAGGRAAGGAGGLEGVAGEPADLPVGARAGGGWGTATPWLVVQPGKGPVVGGGRRKRSIRAVDLTDAAMSGLLSPTSPPELPVYNHQILSFNRTLSLVYKVI